MQPAQETLTWEESGNLFAYPVLVGTDARLSVLPLCKPFDRVVCLGDSTVLRLHFGSLPWLETIPTLELPPGEGSKSWQHLEATVDFLASTGCSRRSLLVTLGGGVVSDLGGLAASLFKRGMGVAHVPTTLLAQVDASIGGKTAINLAAGKNLVGTFHAPQFVLIDPIFLTTLPRTEWQAGLGEVVKTALLARRPIWQALQEQAPSLCQPGQQPSSAWNELIRACVQTKAQWVESDPTEQGSRKALNLGHTFAHAIEHAAGYGAIPHGIAVAMGLVLAFEASRRLGLLEQFELESSLQATLQALGLPLRWRDWQTDPGSRLEVAQLQAGLLHDKKGAAFEPRFVLPLALGQVRWDVKIPEDLLHELWTTFLSERKAETDR